MGFPLFAHSLSIYYQKEEIADRLSLLCIVSCVSLHVSTSSLKLTPTLIYSAPDLLLFCHPDMFSKYCLPAQDTPEVLLSACTEGDGLYVIQAFLSIPSNAPAQEQE